MIAPRHLSIGLVVAIAAAGLPFTVAAHPHVLVDAKSEVVFDADGRMKSVRQVWRFDAAFSAYATQGLDTDGDGIYSDAELKPLAKVNVDSLKEFDFFTFLTVGDNELDFVEPQEYWLELHGDQLTLFYNLPLKEPIAVGPQTTLEVFDPEYFVAFTFVKEGPVTLDSAPAGCSAIYHPPRELDDQTMALLGALPQDQRELPAELSGAAADLANVAEIRCP
jgi:ABC-type uncharacterized transport system substrate-binding protein